MVEIHTKNYTWLIPHDNIVIKIVKRKEVADPHMAEKINSKLALKPVSCRRKKGIRLLTHSAVLLKSQNFSKRYDHFLILSFLFSMGAS
jgi:hypothetical protein